MCYENESTDLSKNVEYFLLCILGTINMKILVYSVKDYTNIKHVRGYNSTFRIAVFIL